MNLSYGSPGRWSIGSVVYLASRNDTNKPNLSPITTGKPIYVAQYGCYNDISIPVVDPDGDDVKCRWANGKECMSICKGLPYATIDYDNCTIRFMANHTSNGTFAVAVTVEDYPKSNISFGGSIHITTSPLSTITLQFIVETPILHAVNCTDKPRFVRPTLAEGTILHTDIFKGVNIFFFASGNSGIANIDLTVPAGMEYTPVQSNMYNNYSVVHSSWIPQQNQVGFHLVCALAKDSLGKTSESRCITIVVKDIDECASQPCENNVTCIDDVNMFKCLCPPNFTGLKCESDDGPCESSPCKHGGTCGRQGLTQNYTCNCVSGYTGRLCETDINECAEQSCSPLFECEDLKDGFSCKLIVWKLLVIGLAVLMILGGFVFLLCFLKRKHNKITADGQPEQQ